MGSKNQELEVAKVDFNLDQHDAEDAFHFEEIEMIPGTYTLEDDIKVKPYQAGIIKQDNYHYKKGTTVLIELEVLMQQSYEIGYIYNNQYSLLEKYEFGDEKEQKIEMKIPKTGEYYFVLLDDSSTDLYVGELIVEM